MTIFKLKNKNLSSKQKRYKKALSKEYKIYKRNKNLLKALIILVQITLLISMIYLWEWLASTGAINAFITSSPSRMLKTLIDLVKNNEIFYHIRVTLSEALISFFLATIGGSLIAIVLWSNDFIRRVLDPYIVVLNSLPKVALGPMIIIWVGIGTSAIVTMAILIMVVITILSMLHAFNSCDKNKILLLQSMNANKFQILTKLILPNALPDFISVLKINVGLTWVGTITGEYLVSRAGLGYLIIFGGQVFKLDLVMTSTAILCILAALMYFVVAYIEKKVSKSYKTK